MTLFMSTDRYRKSVMELSRVQDAWMTLDDLLMSR